MSFNSDQKGLDSVEKSMTEFFQRHRTNEEQQQQQSERSQNEKRLHDALKEAQTDSNILNYLNANRKEPEKVSSKPHPRGHSSPNKRGRPDVKSIFSRKDVTSREKEQVFLQYYDDNLKLKENQTKLEQHIKELKTKLRVIEGEYVYSRKKYEGDELVKDDLHFIEELKRENQTLKQQLKDLSLPRPQLPSQKNKVLVKSTAPKGGISSKTNSDHLRLIDLLKMQLKKAEQEIATLHGQLGSRNVSGMPDMHEKNVKLATLQHRFENLDGAYATQKQMLERNKEMVETLNRQLYQERTRVSQLEVQLRAAEMAAETARDLQKSLDESERERKTLEQRLKNLIETPFFKNMGDNELNPLKLKDAETQLADLNAQLKTLRDKHSTGEKQVIELTAQVKTLEAEKNQMLVEKTKAEALLKEKEKAQSFMNKQMEVFNITNERDKDDFLKALGMIRLRGEEPAWKRLEFIDRHGDLNPNDINALHKEIDRLRLEKSEIAAQLEKTQTLLQTHMEMEKEKEIIHSSEMDKLRLQLRAATSRIEEVTRLADFKARNYKENMLKSGVSYQGYEEGASEFSELTESEMATNENTLDVLVKKARLEELIVRKLLAGKVGDFDSLQTLVTCDFYNHETQNSEMCEGLEPNYNFQIAYKVEVDENLINYMENEFLKFEIFAIVHSDLKLIGTCYISFRELLIKNYEVQFGTSALVQVNGIIYGEKRSDIVGALQVKLRMRHPISEALRWFKERAAFIKETHDTLDMRIDPEVKTRKLMVQIDRIRGLDKRIATFVYYKLYNLRDVCTPTVPGQDPVFNFINAHDLVQNESVWNYLKKESLEFVVFNDTTPLLRNDASLAGNLGDVIGKGKVKLNTLLENDGTIDQIVPLYDMKNSKIGTIFIKVFWYDSNQEKMPEEKGKVLDLWQENMTRNIANALIMKGQTLESAFGILDGDNDGLVNMEEFREALMRIFKVKFNEGELAMYWKRFHLRDDKLPKDEFFTRFAPYMSHDTNMNVTYQKLHQLQQQALVQQGLTPGVGNITQLLNKNTEDMQARLRSNNELLTTLCRRMAEYSKQNYVPIDTLLSRFDRDASGFISRNEMKVSLLEIGIALSENEIQGILQYFDIDNNNKVSVEEFKTMVRSGILEEMRRLKTTSQKSESSVQETRTEVIKFICDHIRQTGMTILEFTKKLDADNSKTIKREELSKFFTDMGIRIERHELEALFVELDPTNTNNVSTKRFIEILGPYIKEKPSMTAGIEKSLIAVANYMKDNKLDLYSYFTKFDHNNNGFIERRELKNQLNQLGVITSDLEVNNLLNFFDSNQDGRISSKEFVNGIQPYMSVTSRVGSMRSLKSADSPNKLFKDLRAKCFSIVRPNSTKLRTGFDVMRELRATPGYITKEKFIEVLNFHNVGFLPRDIDLIVQHLTDHNAEGLINYDKFLKEYSDINNFEKGGDVTESQVLSSYGGEKFERPGIRKLSSAEDIFGKLSKILKENKISAREAFRIFDKDGSKKIGVQELKDAFAGMQLGLTTYQVEEIINQIDKSGDKQIDLEEFVAALKL